MWWLVGFGLGACIWGNATHAIIAFTGAVIIYAVSNSKIPAEQGDK